MCEVEWCARGGVWGAGGCVRVVARAMLACLRGAVRIVGFVIEWQYTCSVRTQWWGCVEGVDALVELVVVWEGSF